MAATRWDDLARTKLVRIMGATAGEVVFEETLRKLKVQRLSSVDDLYQFAQVLKNSTPVIAAVGAMLSLSAVINGANPEQVASFAAK